MELKLPYIIASRKDIIRLHREVRQFIDIVSQSIMRHDNPIKYPEITDHLRAVATENQVNLRSTKHCEILLGQLESLKDKAPSVHVSFPVEPNAEILQKLVNWFRQEIDPHVVIQVGIQPTIAAGVVLRTPNKQFDFSLRQHLYRNRDKLREAIDSVQ